jgi:hypothetical protein
MLTLLLNALLVKPPVPILSCLADLSSGCERSIDADTFVSPFLCLANLLHLH